MRLRYLTTALALVALASPAVAACDANNTYTFAFQNQPTASLNYANSYFYTASNPLGASRNFTTTFAINGMTSTRVAGVQMPRIDNALISSGSGAKTLMVGGVFSSRTASITSGTRGIRVTFTFAVPIRDLAIVVHDIDYTFNQFRDWLHVSGSDGTNTYVPSLTSPHGNNNSGTPTAATSTVRFGPGTTPFAISSSEGVGIGTSANTNSNSGDVQVSFAQPVTSVSILYGNYPLQSGETATGQQAYGISEVRFCPLPQLSVAKSSAPYASTGPDRFNAPGSDVAYSLTVTNSGGSPVDLASLVLSDTLPANVTFYNGDYNAASPGMGPFELVAGTSGVTLPAGSATFSQNGAAYTTTAAPGYAPLVRFIRITAGGSLAANSRLTIRFRARVN